ncbi:hypothetical protein Pint_04313 [Pistacia integerrima]|uniref:Uncharacterized protein n=1 Tax=Pistacia integerrima TaxID=434235 RepID=A0ACC0Z2P3_9ROSI|nr:hypothetical protein Pint_04313 [Pistacia integerrima]
MPNRNSISHNSQELEALFCLADLVLDFDDEEEQEMNDLDQKPITRLVLSGNSTNDMMVDHVQVEEQAHNKQDVDKKRKRPLLEASTEEEKIKPRKNVKEIILGEMHFDNVRSNDYLNNLVTDSGTQRLFLEAILGFFEEIGEHPLKRGNRIDFLMDTLGVVGVQIEDFNKAIRMVWPNVKDLQISSIEKALSDNTRFACTKK